MGAAETNGAPSSTGGSEEPSSTVSEVGASTALAVGDGGAAMESRGAPPRTTATRRGSLFTVDERKNANTEKTFKEYKIRNTKTQINKTKKHRLCPHPHTRIQKDKKVMQYNYSLMPLKLLGGRLHRALRYCGCAGPHLTRSKALLEALRKAHTRSVGGIYTQHKLYVHADKTHLCLERCCMRLA